MKKITQVRDMMGIDNLTKMSFSLAGKQKLSKNLIHHLNQNLCMQVPIILLSGR